MSKYSNDPLINVVHQQIKDPIKLLIDYKHYSAAVKLIYAGIDTMATLGLPSNKQDVTKTDYIKWVEQYIRFDSHHQLTGWDVYGARCSMLHSHSTYSSLSRQGKCRLIAYVDKMQPPVIFNPQVDKTLVIVAVTSMADSFFDGVDKYLVDLFSHPRKKHVAEKRLETFVQNISIGDKLKNKNTEIK